MSFSELSKIYVQVFFLLTPFCVVSVFLSLTSGLEESRRRQLAFRTTAAMAVIVLLFFFAGKYIFSLFGITLEAFRVGAGAILFLSAVALVSGNLSKLQEKDDDDFSVVPLAMPLTVGPGTIGALLVMSVAVNNISDKIFVSITLVACVLSVGVLIYISNILNKILGKQGIAILIRITGLILGALSAQLILDGLKGFISSLS